MSDEADQDRIGKYVRRALPRELARRGIPWTSIRVDWFPRAIFFVLQRGGLTIEEGVTIGGPSATGWAMIRPEDNGFAEWWKPTTKDWAQEITQALASKVERWYRRFQDADEEGRTRATVWPDPEFTGRYRVDPIPEVEPITLKCAPGVLVERSPVRDQYAVLWKYKSGNATIREGMEQGWCEVEG